MLDQDLRQRGKRGWVGGAWIVPEGHTFFAFRGGRSMFVVMLFLLLVLLFVLF